MPGVPGPNALVISSYPIRAFADAGTMVIDGMFVRRPITGAAARSSTPRAPRPAGTGWRHSRRPQAWSRSSRPGRILAPERLGMRMRPALILVPSRPSTAGSRVRVAASTATTDSMMPRAMERNAGLGTSKMAARDPSTVRALKATALPAVSTVSATAATTPASSPGSDSSPLRGRREIGRRGTARSRSRERGRTSRRS